MIPALKSEFRKMFTVRSTYFILVFTVLIVLFFAGFITGYRINADDLKTVSYLSSQITSIVGAVTVLGAIVGLLLFGHEYRFNTIIYSLTLSNRRSKVLAAKIVAVTVFSIFFTLIVAVLSPLVTILGIHLHHLHLVAQSINYGTIWWKCLLYGWGFSILALIIVAIIRNQIGAIVAFFLIPTTVENLLALLLKNNSKYLPFTALAATLDGSSITGPSNPHTEALIAIAYIVGGIIVTWVLFMKRDAN